MMRKGSVFVVLLILGLLGAAGPAGAATKVKATVPTAKSLLDREYASVEATGNPILKGRTIRVDFFKHAFFSKGKEKPMIRVEAGCNSWAIKFGIRRGRLATYGPTDSSAMGCTKDPDPWLMRTFRKGLKVREVGKRLVMTRPAERIRFVFKEIRVAKYLPDVVIEEPEPEPRVTTPATMEDVDGRSYEAIYAIGRDLDESLEIHFTTGTLPRRDEDGRQVTGPLFGFYVGCNHNGGEYRIEAGILSWTDVITTLMLCHGSPERWLGEFFMGDPEIGLDGTDLVIRKNGLEIVFREIRN